MSHQPAAAARLAAPAPAEKFPEPRPIFFRLKPEWSARLDRVCLHHNRERNDLARCALFDRIAELEAAAAPVHPEIARQVNEAQRLGLNVERVLAHAIDCQIRAARAVVEHGPFPHRD